MQRNTRMGSDSIPNIKSKINDKEGKRVSNVLYTPNKIFSESHVPGIQKLTNESTQFKWYVVAMASCKLT